MAADAGQRAGFLSEVTNEVTACTRLRSPGRPACWTKRFASRRAAAGPSGCPAIDVINTMVSNMRRPMLTIEADTSPGDLVRFRAETDLVVVMSACPQDLTPVNGAAQSPVDVHFRLSDE